MIELEMLSGVAAGQHVKTKVPFISLGRAPERTIVIDDPFVSRHHGEILLLNSGYQYRDLNSTHGTSLRRGGEENLVRQVELHAGDELAIGRPENILRVQSVELDGIDNTESSVTRLHTRSDEIVAPEDKYAQDSKILRALVAFDSAIMEASITGERLLYRTLLTHLPSMIDRLEYVAVLEIREDQPQPFDFELISRDAKVRLSSSITQMASEQERGTIFEIRDMGTLVGEGKSVPLSDASMVMSVSGRVTIQTGICVPIPHAAGNPKYLQLERSAESGNLVPKDLDLVVSMVMRVGDRLNNFRLIEQNQRLRHTASLGMFASMIGHDIKNYLFYSQKLSEIQNDTLSDHIGLTKGIERARKLAQSMKDLAGPGRITLTTFSVVEMAEAVVQEFGSLFGEKCTFEVMADEDLPEVTTNEDLLYRVVWNLVMNAYHSMENRPSSATSHPAVRIRIKHDTHDRVSVGVIDNAGGIGPKTMGYIERLFQLISDVYREREDLLDVLDELNCMSGFKNSIGLFFIATAVNDMHGTLKVDTKDGEGSVLIVKIPQKIEALKNLLIY